MNDERLAVLTRFIEENSALLEQGVTFSDHAVMRFAYLVKSARECPDNYRLSEAEAGMERLRVQWAELDGGTL